MAENSQPVVAPLVIGLTRPRMMWGVPIGLFVGELMLVVMIFLNTKNLVPSCSSCHSMQSPSR